MHFCLTTFMNRAVTDPHSHCLSSIGRAFLFLFVSARRLCCSSKHPNSVAHKQSFFPTHATCPSQVSRKLFASPRSGLHSGICGYKEISRQEHSRSSCRQNEICRILHWHPRYSLNITQGLSIHTFHQEKQVTWSHGQRMDSEWVDLVNTLSVKHTHC